MWVWAVAGLACLASDLRAAISVTLPGGSPFITFATNPPASEISQRTVVGASFDITDAAGLDAVVQTNEFTMITLQLEADPGHPPAPDANPRWSSTGRYAQTRPIGNAASLMMATFQNDTGGHFTGALQLGYQLTIISPAAEQVDGHLVYYSFSGLTNTWVQLPTISNQPDDNMAGIYPRSARIDFSATPWPAGSLFYVLWADDNSSGAETARQIDHLALLVDNRPPSITDPVNATVEECRGTNFSVEILGGSLPITIRWLKDGVPIDPGVNPSAATTTLILTNVQTSDSGSYVARATNPFSFDDSAAATLTVNSDNTPPALVRALGDTDWTTITITFSEPMNDEAGVRFNYLVCTPDELGDCLTVNSATLSADFTTVTLTTSAATAGVTYLVLVVEGVADRCNGNALADPRIFISHDVVILAADCCTQWRYNHDGVDLGTAWRQYGYDDSSWSNGVAAFGVEDSPPAHPALRTPLLRTNANFPSGTAVIPTYYFRTHFNFPGRPHAGFRPRLRFRAAIDDYAYIYINGQEVYRDPFLGSVGGPELPYATYTGGTAIGNAAWGPYIDLTVTNLVPWDNVLAVQLKQQAGGSADVYMALELLTGSDEVMPCDCPTITDQPDSVVARELDAVQFMVTADGGSLQYQWHKNGGPIPGANQRTYSIPSVHPRDAGSYRVRVFNACVGENSVLSAAAILTVGHATPPRVNGALGLAGQTNILINFTNGPLDTAGAQNLTNYTIPGLTVQSAVLQQNRRDVLLTTTPRTIGQNYSLTVKDVTDAAETPNVIFPNPTVINPLAQVVRLIEWHHGWKFDTNCQTDLAWAGLAYDDSAWSYGLAPIGAETGGATLTAITNITGDGILTPILAPSANNVHNHYFRTHFTMFEQDPTAVTWAWNSLHDDGAILYLNGAELWRRNITNNLSASVVCPDQASSHEADTLSSLNDPPPNLRVGDNVVVAHVKQNGMASGDIVWALQLDITVLVFRPPRPTLCIFREDQSVRIVWPCPAGSPAADGYVLQGADDLAGPWATVPAASPYQVGPDAARQFYRLCQGPCH